MVPPALGARAAAPSSASVTLPAPNELRGAFPGYPPLPAGRAPEVSIKEVTKRFALDSPGTLTGRLITVVGFTLKDGAETDLARVTIFCCAADARLESLHLRGPRGGSRRPRSYPITPGYSVEGTLIPPPPTGDPDAVLIATMAVTSLTRIEAPANTYAY